MLRKGIVAFMMAVMSVASVSAEDRSDEKRIGLLGWLRRQAATSPDQSASTGSTGVRHAVVVDAEQQVPEVRQASQMPQPEQPQPGAEPLQPMPIQYAPAVPNTNPRTGPQYFSAVNPAGNTLPVHPGRNWQQYSAPAPVHRTSAAPYRGISNTTNNPASNDNRRNDSRRQAGQTRPVPGPHNTGAALYPAPVPGIPQQVGGTLIPTQALHPHEMMYAHRYKAMYPPYYYKVNGGWMVTPWGTWSKENWKLQGTMVDVKYKSYISPFALFTPPR